jgi:hypothetical protein
MYLASRSMGFAVQMGKYSVTAMTMMNNLQNQRPWNREGNKIKIKEREKINTVHYYYYWRTLLNFCLNMLTINYFYHHLHITTQQCTQEETENPISYGSAMANNNP